MEVASTFGKPQIVVCGSECTHKLSVAGVPLVLAVTPRCDEFFQILVIKDYLHRNWYLLAKIRINSQ
jgi:hypothetical protein